MIAAANDQNDPLQLRLLRTDYGALNLGLCRRRGAGRRLVRARAQQPQQDALYLPRLAHAQLLQSDMGRHHLNRRYVDKMPPPSQSAITAAIEQLCFLNVVNSGGVVTGSITAYTHKGPDS